MSVLLVHSLAFCRHSHRVENVMKNKGYVMLCGNGHTMGKDAKEYLNGLANKSGIEQGTYNYSQEIWV